MRNVVIICIVVMSQVFHQFMLGWSQSSRTFLQIDCSVLLRQEHYAAKIEIWDQS